MAIIQGGTWDTHQGPGGALLGGAAYNQFHQGMLDPDVAAQVGAQKYGADQQLQAAKLAMQAQELPAQLQQQRFNSVFPWLQSQLGKFGSQMARPGGQSGASPEITVGGVLNPQQIQQQVNAMKSGNEQSSATQQQQQSRDLAGRGFGANSPLLAALHNQTQAATLGQNVGGERDIRLNAANANAGQLLKSQQAREQQFASRQQEDIQRRQPYFSMANTLLSSLAGLV